MLAAFEATLQRTCKDEAEWSRKRQSLYRPPAGERRPAPSAAAGAQTVAGMEAMLARMNAADERLGAL